jgi:hypothetical protein
MTVSHAVAVRSLSGNGSAAVLAGPLEPPRALHWEQIDHLRSLQFNSR